MTAGLTVSQLARAVAQRSAGELTAELLDAADRVIDSVAALSTAGPRQLGFLANPRYRSQAASSRAGALVLGPSEVDALRGTGRALIVCEEPYAWFAFAAQELAREVRPGPGISPAAVVAACASVDAGARIDAQAVVAAGATIGPGAWIQSGAYVGEGARVGEGTRLHPRACVLDGCAIGARCIVHSGAVIGADGFGFAALKGRWIKIPQSGSVVVGDDVEIGANTTIDRGTMGDTVIEEGVKIDNQVQIAHNCRIGAHTAIAGCVGIAGSAVIGRRCQLGGAAMIHGHIAICDDVVVSGGTLISRSITKPGFYSGVFPFMQNRDWERNAAIVRHLHELRARLRHLEGQLGTGRGPGSGS